MNLTTNSAQWTTCGAGLMMTAEPAASAAIMPPVGMAMGKFHGGTTTVTWFGVNSERDLSIWRAQ